MKTTKLSLLALAVFFSFASCSENTEDILTLNNSEDILKANTWKVEYYLNNNLDETIDFDGFELSFKSDGKVIAKKAWTEFTGSWVEDKVTKDIFFNFNQSIDPFNRISEGWKIQQKGDGKFKLVNASETELLRIAIK